jgi:uncharacterized membrane protein
MNSNQEQEYIFWRTVAIILFVILCVVIFIATFGQCNIAEEKSPDESTAQRRERLTHRHNKLKQLVQRKMELKKRLDRVFRWSYFGVRIAFIVLWAFYNYILISIGLVKNDLGTILNLNEATLIGLIVIIYLLYGSVRCVTDFVAYSKKVIESWVYQRYLDIDAQIYVHQVNVKITHAEIKSIDNSQLGIDSSESIRT